MQSIFLNRLLSALFPLECVNCKKKIESRESHPLCKECFTTIPTLSGFYCPECKRRLPSPERICHPRVPYVLAAATSFDIPAVRNLIHAVKYNHIKDAIFPLAQIVNSYYLLYVKKEVLQDENWIAIPIPLHQAKLRKRGFNQSMVLYETLAKNFNTPLPALHAQTLLRNKNTHSQTQCKNFEARSKNVENSFAVNAAVTLQKKNVLLIDDVSTSGATLKEAARTLKNHGAKKIIALVIAKA